jgi:hypothetical protein
MIMDITTILHQKGKRQEIQRERDKIEGGKE